MATKGRKSLCTCIHTGTPKLTDARYADHADRSNVQQRYKLWGQARDQVNTLLSTLASCLGCSTCKPCLATCVLLHTIIGLPNTTLHADLPPTEPVKPSNSILRSTKAETLSAAGCTPGKDGAKAMTAQQAQDRTLLTCAKQATRKRPNQGTTHHSQTSRATIHKHTARAHRAQPNWVHTCTPDSNGAPYWLTVMLIQLCHYWGYQCRSCTS
jgi:hypothetical protein